MKVEYDPKCEELARWFLDERIRDDEDALVAELAGVIQLAIEGWFEGQETGAAGGEA
jgi:hypothetical protein